VDVRSQILSTATRLFARRGFDGTSLSAIADEVGIKKPSLLYHFPSKEALRQSVIDALVQHWNEVVPRVLATVTRGEDRFDALARELVGFFEVDPDRARLVVRELMDRPEDMRRQLGAAFRPWVALLAESIERGKRDRSLHGDVDPEAYVLHVVTLIVSGIAARPILGPIVPGDDQGRRYDKELLRIARASLFRSSREGGS
jgi:AcrR family transcriptional regulator